MINVAIIDTVLMPLKVGTRNVFYRFENVLNDTNCVSTL